MSAPNMRLVLSDLQKRYPKLTGASVESIDEEVAKELSASNFAPTGEGHDPAALNRVASQARDALSRAFSRRSDLLDLNTRSIQRALQFDRWIAVKEAELTAALSTIGKKQADALASANEAAAALFVKQGSSEALAMGKQAEGAGLANSDRASQEGVREAALRTIHSANVAYEAALQTAHERENGPLNYPERLNRLREIYIRELKAAAEAVYAYRRGLLIFSLWNGELGHDQFLPDYIYRLHNLFYECERLRLKDEASRVELTRVVSVTFSRGINDGGPPQEYPADATFEAGDDGPSGYITWSRAPAYVKNGKLLFRLSSASLFPGLADIRVIAMGMRCAYRVPQAMAEWDAVNLVKLQQKRFAASPGLLGCRVTPPRRASDIARPPIRLGQIALVDGGSPFDPICESGPNVESCAINGRWIVDLDDKLQFPNGTRGRDALVIEQASDQTNPAKLLDWNGFLFRGVSLFLRVSGKLATPGA